LCLQSQSNNFQRKCQTRDCRSRPSAGDCDSLGRRSGIEGRGLASTAFVHLVKWHLDHDSAGRSARDKSSRPQTTQASLAVNHTQGLEEIGVLERSRMSDTDTGRLRLYSGFRYQQRVKANTCSEPTQASYSCSTSMDQGCRCRQDTSASQNKLRNAIPYPTSETLTHRRRGNISAEERTCYRNLNIKRRCGDIFLCLRVDGKEQGCSGRI
jgi:hypothetical protein